MADKPTFKTKDIHLAAFLRLKGIPIVSVDKPEGRGLAEFHFNNPEECRQMNIDWVNDEATGNIAKYVVQLMKLKKLC